MSKGVFLDLDGTLLNDQHQVSPQTQNVIAELLKRDVAVYLVTGMSQANALEIYNKLNLNTFLSSSMGQMISKPNDKKENVILHSTSFTNSMQAVNKMKTFVKVNNFALELGNGEIVINKKEGSSHLLSLLNNTSVKLIESSNTENKDVISILVEVEKISNDHLTELVNKLNETSNTFLYEYWLPEDNLPIIHIRTKAYGKWEAVSFIIKHDKLDEVYAFGNGWNDRYVLKNVKNSYAMLNADNKVKSFARYVTEFDNNHNGVAIELKKLIDKNTL